MRSESDGHCLATTWPGLAFRARRRRRSPAPLVASLFDRYHPSVADFLSHVARAARAQRLGAKRARERASSACARSTAASSSTGTASSGTCCSRPATPGLNVPGGAARRSARRPLLRAARLRVERDGRRRRPRGRDRVAERARRRCRGRLGAPPRAACACRSTCRASTSPRRGLAPFHRLGAGERAARLRVLLAPSYPPGKRFDEPLARAAEEGRFRVEPSVNGSRAGDLRDGLRARLRGTTRCSPRSSASTGSRRPTTGSCSIPMRRCRRSPTRRERSRSPARPRSGRSPRPTRSPAPATSATPSSGGSAHVVHAERTARVAARRAAAGRRRGVRARARRAQLVAGRGGRPDARDRACARPAGLPPAARRTSRAGPRCRSARLELGLLLGCMRLAGIAAPLGQAVALFAGGWLARAAARACRLPAAAPRLRGGRRRARPARHGHGGSQSASRSRAPARPRTRGCRRSCISPRGVHQGPLVITRREVLVGAPGAVVRGGIVIRADGVTIKNVSVVGGENGITVDGYRGAITRRRLGVGREARRHPRPGRRRSASGTARSTCSATSSARGSTCRTRWATA